MSAGPQQRPNNIINRISFPPTGGGLIYFTLEVRDNVIDVNPTPGGPSPIGDASTPPPLYPAMVRFSNDALEGIDALGDFPWFQTNNIVPDILSFEEKNKTVPIVSPASDEMIKHYAVWTPFEQFDQQLSTGIGSFDVYVIDTAQWMLIYNHTVTFRATTWNKTRDEALNEFRGLAGTTGYEFMNDPDLMAVDFLDNLGNPWPSLPDALTVRALAEGGGSWHVEPGTPQFVYGRRTVGYWVLNLGLVKKMLNEQNKDAKSFRFDIRMPKKNGLRWKMEAGVIPQGFNKGVSVNPTTKFPVFAQASEIVTCPDFFSLPPIKQGFGSNPNGTVDVEVFFQTKDAQGHTIPPTLTMDDATSGGGGGEG